MKTTQAYSNEKGANLVEFSLVAALLILLIFGIIDFSRYVSVKSMMRKATQSAARAASTIDAMDVSLSAGTTSGQEKTEFFDSHRSVEAMAYNITNTVMDRSDATVGNADEYMQLKPYVTDASDNQVTDIAIIMPGERVSWADESSGSRLGTTSDHPSLSTCSAADCDSPNYTQTLRDHPIVAEMRASVSFLIPFLGRQDVVVRSYAYREDPQRPTEFNAGNPEPEPCTLQCTTPPKTRLDPGPCRCICPAFSCNPVTQVENWTTCTCDPRPPSSSSSSSSSSGGGGGDDDGAPTTTRPPCVRASSCPPFNVPCGCSGACCPNGGGGPT